MATYPQKIDRDKNRIHTFFVRLDRVTRTLIQDFISPTVNHLSKKRIRSKFIILRKNPNGKLTQQMEDRCRK